MPKWNQANAVAAEATDAEPAEPTPVEPTAPEPVAETPTENEAPAEPTEGEAAEPAPAAADTTAVDPSEQPYFAGYWSSLPNFQCPYCAHATVEAGGSGAIELHILAMVDAGDLKHLPALEVNKKKQEGV